MSTADQFVDCAGIVPDLLLTLEPITLPENTERMVVAFRNGTGGLLSAAA